MLWPNSIRAISSETKIEYQTYQGQIAFNSPGIPATDAWEAFELVQSRSTNQKRPAKGYNCVAWAKQVTGVYGTWGNGGHYLSLNSDGEIGDVLIFKGTHVAVVIARTGSLITLTEANYDYRGSIRTRTIQVSDPSIRGFHHF